MIVTTWAHDGAKNILSTQAHVTDFTYEATDDAVRAADGERQVDGGDLPEGGGQQRGERPQHQRLLLEQAFLRRVPGKFIEIEFNIDLKQFLSIRPLLALTGAQTQRAHNHHPSFGSSNFFLGVL